MPDMLVKLYELPDLAPELAAQKTAGVDIRRALNPERHLVLHWIEGHFSRYWVSECSAAFSRQPVSCFVAVSAGKLLGFSCYDVTAKGLFGPMGVDELARGRGIGRGLLLACLHAMYAEGYAYAVIGSVGPADFYSKTVGATIIPDSSPGIYRGMLQE
jgi:GNAT superfamily N-acetyltransferase